MQPLDSRAVSVSLESYVRDRLAERLLELGDLSAQGRHRHALARGSF